VRLLVDSHVARWWLEGNDKLGITRALGKLDFPDGLADALVAGGFTELPVSAAHGELAASLPPHHHDPFDRMLIAQAGVEALVQITADRAMQPYDLDLIDARG
jgi:PIN domain nuclease of toxin-antitoxin system